jgi:hypothetical protein
LHSKENLFKYEENIFFVKTTLIPYFNSIRDEIVVKCQQSHRSNWKNYMHVTISFADGASARYSAINASMKYYRYISIIYISCKINKYPRTAKEIADIFKLDVTCATKGCKNAVSIINNIEKDVVNKDKTLFCKIKPEDFIERFCSKLNINTELTKVCKFISTKIEQLDLMPENTPHSIAAGIIYFISQNCNLSISKKDVKNISEISEVTINKCFKKLETIKDKLIPAVIIQKYAS